MHHYTKIFFCCALLFSCTISTQHDQRGGIELHGTPSHMYDSQIERLKEIIVHHPQDLLIDHDRILYTVRKTHTLPQSLVESNQHSYPLFMLYECVWQDEDFDDPEESYACRLSRLTQPLYRSTFEHHIGHAIEEAYKKSGDAVNCVNLGPGNLFQDLVIATQALQKNITKLHVHLIDPAYQFYIKAITAIQPSHAPYDISKNYDFEKIAADIDFDHQDLVSHNISFNHEMFRQFVTWFKTAFPHAEVRILIYSSLYEYLSDCQQRPELKADVLYMCDPDPEGFNGQIPDFIYSLIFALKKDGIALELGKELAITVHEKNFDSQVPYFENKKEFDDHYRRAEPDEQFRKEYMLISETKRVIKLKKNKKTKIVHDEL